MMYLIQESTLTSIADAIRLKTNKSEAFTPAAMISEVRNLSAQEDELIMKENISVYKNSTVRSIGRNAFQNCTNLIEIDLPNVSIIYAFAFATCNLISVNLPKVEIIDQGGINNNKITRIDLPELTLLSNQGLQACGLIYASVPKLADIRNQGFKSNYSLVSITLPQISIMGNSVFAECYNLVHLYLPNSIVCTLSNANTFQSTPMAGYTESAGQYGSIYVPASLLTTYKTATNWATFADRFVGI